MQCNFCSTLTNLQICVPVAVMCNFCAISYACVVQFGLALSRSPNIDQLSVFKIDCLTGNPWLSMFVAKFY